MSRSPSRTSSGSRGARDHHRAGLRGPPAGRRVRPRRLHRHRPGYRPGPRRAAQPRAVAQPGRDERGPGRAAPEGRYEATAIPPPRGSDVVTICVPTPLRKSKDPDISYVVAAAEQVVGAVPAPISSSCSNPRRTRGPPRSCSCPMSRRGAPRRERLLPRVLAGAHRPRQPRSSCARSRRSWRRHAACTDDGRAAVPQIVERVVEVSGPKVAELAKLYENVFRNVNIALANEFALMCRRLGVRPRGHRRGGQQAVRVHGLLPGPGHRRALHRRRPFLPGLDDAASGYEARFIHWRTRSTGPCPCTWSTRWPKRSTVAGGA